MSNSRRTGLIAAFASAVFLGLAPVFGKQAIGLGLSPLGLVALRTGGAASLLFLYILIFRRPYLYIYPAGLLGCALAGGINGLGSLFYYGSLARIDASLGQLLYSLYPLFVMLLLWLDGQPPARITLLRLGMAMPGVALLVQGNHAPPDLVGVAMMLIGSLLYALHLPINQRVLYDMPAPTVTMYTLASMSAVVIPAYLISRLWFDAPPLWPALSLAWFPALALMGVTFFSRLTLFMGVKHLGGLQTALLGLGELFVTIMAARLLLNENLGLLQWLGAALLLGSILLVTFDRTPPGRPQRSFAPPWLSWLRPPGLPKDMPWPRD